ncbi:hypothetical protein JTB14_025214 [Gonioctena quinquepunctata]|nr:hypothetical protein JTB14_025214 [Gonioctena quinquepunctata]
MPKFHANQTIILIGYFAEDRLRDILRGIMIPNIRPKATLFVPKGSYCEPKSRKLQLAEPILEQRLQLAIEDRNVLLDIHPVLRHLQKSKACRLVENAIRELNKEPLRLCFATNMAKQFDRVRHYDIKTKRFCTLQNAIDIPHNGFELVTVESAIKPKIQLVDPELPRRQDNKLINTEIDIVTSNISWVWMR